MSGAAVPVGRGGGADTPTRPARAWFPGASRREATRAARPAILIELPLFTALAILGMSQWARLVDPSSAGRLMAALGVACAAAIALWGLSFAGSRRVRTGLAIAVSLAGVAGALLAAGLPAELLKPAQWGELRHHLRSGMGGIEEAQLPYGGTDPWVRLTLVLGAPALVALAAVLAFWPAAKRGFLRVSALGLLLITYGVGATLDNPGAEAFWGIVLLVLAAGWLWLPGLEHGTRARAVAVTVGAGMLTLPFVAGLNGPAWWDYESWSWFGAERTVRFDWDHDYGPLDWPRDGTTMMTVDAESPLYWKASVLDRFDGYRWLRPSPGDPTASAELAARGRIPGAGVQAQHPGWVVSADFELRALTSDVVIGAGITNSIAGIDGTLRSNDGTIAHVGDPLERGQKYSIVAYVPQPTPDQLRSAPPATSRRRFDGSTLLGIPSPDSAATTVRMPLWGDRRDRIDALLAGSPYADTYRLAHEWTADAATPYDAVHAIEAHLRRDYAYTPTVPEHLYPLPSFLFDDRAGYCQQFAGTMGLMLRMLGIPTRVVSGFAPGALDANTGVYDVHDFDAHSWVEVYFRGIGWVTFDPTPGAAPAESQRLGGEFATEFRGPGPNPTTPQQADSGGRATIETSDPAAVATGDAGGPWPAIALGILAVVAAFGIAIGALSWRRRRRLLDGDATEDQIAEFRDALGRLGWRIGPRTTLLAIEHRATGAARAGIRAYAASLRTHRYAPGATRPPGPAERRAFRRSLRGSSLRSRLRALLAVPPGGPARA
jgi:transglutaminase-like putative cysteine protease